MTHCKPGHTACRALRPRHRRAASEPTSPHGHRRSDVSYPFLRQCQPTSPRAPSKPACRAASGQRVQDPGLALQVRFADIQPCQPGDLRDPTQSSCLRPLVFPRYIGSRAWPAHVVSLRTHRATEVLSLRFARILLSLLDLRQTAADRPGGGKGQERALTPDLGAIEWINRRPGGPLRAVKGVGRCSSESPLQSAIPN
jgi:hypothetical protein